MNTPVSIRAVQTADIPFLWEMLYEAIHVEPGGTKPPRESLNSGPLAHYLAHWGRPGDSAFIAEMGGSPVGAAWFRLLPATDKGYGYVADDIPELSVAIAAGARGRGIGTRLLERLIAQAQQEGYRGISLSVDSRNPAVRLYERMGFQSVGAEGGSWTMLRPLQEP